MHTGARYLKRGDSYDPEDFRMTSRLRAAQVILKATGVNSETRHDEHSHEFVGGCTQKCVTVWESWVTDEVFEAAFRLANEVYTKRGEHNRREAYEAKKGQEANRP